jgi:hypothetical protein
METQARISPGSVTIIKSFNKWNIHKERNMGILTKDCIKEQRATGLEIIKTTPEERL